MTVLRSSLAARGADDRERCHLRPRRLCEQFPHRHAHHALDDVHVERHRLVFAHLALAPDQGTHATGEAESSATVQLLDAMLGISSGSGSSGSESTLQQLMANTDADSMLLGVISRQSVGADVFG